MAKLSKISAPLIGIGIVLVAGIIIGVWLRGGSKGVITTKSEQQMTDTQIASIQDIGQWELLTITDEEMADTTRTSFWGKSSLVRIYYGTLRLGINMKHTTTTRCASHCPQLNCSTATLLTRHAPARSTNRDSGPNRTGRHCTTRHAGKC